MHVDRSLDAFIIVALQPLQQHFARENPPAAPGPDALSARERQVVAYAKLGHHNKLIAYELGISQSTVKAHLRSIMMKLKAKNRTEAACMLAQEAERAKQIIHG